MIQRFLLLKEGDPFPLLPAPDARGRLRAHLSCGSAEAFRKCFSRNAVNSRSCCVLLYIWVRLQSRHYQDKYRAAAEVLAAAAAAAQMVENSARFRKSKEKRWNIWPGGGLTEQRRGSCLPSARGPQRGALGSVHLPLIADSAQRRSRKRLKTSSHIWSQTPKRAINRSGRRRDESNKVWMAKKQIPPDESGLRDHV